MRGNRKKLYSSRFPLIVITQETINGLDEIHRKIMRIRDPGMETYSILLHDLLPLLKANPPLYEEFIARKDIEHIEGELLDESIIKQADAFRFVFELLHSGDHRMEYLGNEEKLFEAQQIIDIIFKELLDFANERISKKIVAPASRKSDGRLRAKFISGHIRIGEKTCKIRGNIAVTSFCDRMFNKAKVGVPVYWEDIHEFVYSSNRQIKKSEWRKIYNFARRVNAITLKNDMGELLKFEGGESGKVTRLQ